MDSFTFKPKATFFILGWIAKKLPELVIEIHKRGHEVASHGFNHHLCNNLDQKELELDLTSSKAFLDDLIGDKIYGYRAPSFAINDTILQTIQNAGYLYDSSYNSFSGHGRYGTIDLSKAIKAGISYKISENFFEIPISNLKLNNKVWPLGGGGYFRLLPLLIFKWGMKRTIQENNGFVFYSHPWEFDPNQPRVEEAAKGFKFRHYINLHKTENKLKNLITSFSNHNFTTCKDYINNPKKTLPI